MLLKTIGETTVPCTLVKDPLRYHGEFLSPMSFGHSFFVSNRRTGRRLLSAPMIGEGEVSQSNLCAKGEMPFWGIGRFTLSSEPLDARRAR